MAIQLYKSGDFSAESIKDLKVKAQKRVIFL